MSYKARRFSYTFVCHSNTGSKETIIKKYFENLLLVMSCGTIFWRFTSQNNLNRVFVFHKGSSLRVSWERRGLTSTIMRAVGGWERFNSTIDCVTVYNIVYDAI